MPVTDRVPLVLGVVCQPGFAHDQAQRLSDDVKRFTGQLLKLFPHTPLLLLSALNEPTEVIIVQAALEEGRMAVGPPRVEFVVVSSGPPVARAPAATAHEVRKEVTASAPLDPNVPTDGSLPSGSHPIASIRDHLIADYRQINCLEAGLLAGWIAPQSPEIWVAHHCQALLTVYDSQQAPQAVSMKLHGAPATPGHPPGSVDQGTNHPDDPFEAPETGPVVRFLTLPVEQDNWEWLTPQTYPPDTPERQAYLDRLKWVVKNRLDLYNRDIRDLIPQHCAGWAQSQNDLMSDAEIINRPLSDTTSRLRDAFATADFLAQHNQSKFRIIRWGLIALVFVSIAVFAVYAHLMLSGSYKPIALFFYLLLIESAICIKYIVSSGFTRQEKYQDFRALAEGLRVQFGWSLGGVRQFAADHYQAHHKTSLDWIRLALKGLAVRAEARHPATNNSSGNITDRTDDSMSFWVISQLAFYIKASLREWARYEFYHAIAVAYLLISLSTSFIVALMHSSRVFMHTIAPTKEPMLDWLSLTVKVGFTVTVSIFLWYYWKKSDEPGSPSTDEADQLRQDRDIARTVISDKQLLNNEQANPIEVGWIAFSNTIIYSILLFFGVRFLLALFSRTADIPNILQEDLEEWLIVIMVMCATIAAVAQWYSEQLAFRIHHRDYRRMRVVFARAATAIQRHRASRPEVVRRIFLRLGAEALSEHAEWVRVHRERPLELPHLEL